MIARVRMNRAEGGFGWELVRARRLANFCLSRERGTTLYDLTHIASGYGVGGRLSKQEAVRLAKRLNALSVDWRFKEPCGPRWEKAKKLAAPIVRGFK